MPLQHADAFLFVALEEGYSVSEYAKRAGNWQSKKPPHRQASRESEVSAKTVAYFATRLEKEP